MPPKKHLWWDFFKVSASEACCLVTILDDDGNEKECGQKYTPGITNLKRHLEIGHKLKENTEAFLKTHQRCLDAKAKIESKLKQAKIKVAINEEHLSQKELEVIAHASTFSSFRSCGDLWFRAAFSPQCREEHDASATTVATADRLQARDIKLAARSVSASLQLDSGTVWERYLTFLLQAGQNITFVAAMTDCDFANESQTVDEVKDAINSHVLSLRQQGVKIANVIPDNCSNVASAARECIAWETFCAAHTVQLLVKDYLAASNAQPTLDFCVRLGNESKEKHPELPAAPQVNDTRWNSAYRLLEWTSKHSGVLLVDDPTLAADIIAARELKDQLEPLMEATMLAQTKGANTIDACSIFRTMQQKSRQGEEWKRLVPRRQQMLVSQPLAIISFFAPVHEGKRVAEGSIEKYYSAMEKILTSTKTLHLLDADPEKLPENKAGMITEFYRFLAGPGQEGKEEEVTTTSMDEWVVKELANFPRLQKVVLAALHAGISEADVERWFSALKRTVPPERKNMAAKTRTSQTYLHVWAKCHPEIAEEQLAKIGLAGVKRARENPTIVEDTQTTIDRSTMRRIREMVVVVFEEKEAQTQRRARRAPARENANKCHACGKAADAHAETVQWVCCDLCNKWFALSCLGLPANMAAHFREMQSWTCRRCHHEN